MVFLDSLEKLSSAELVAVRRQLVEIEIEEVNDNEPEKDGPAASLSLLQDVAKDVDPVLHEAAREKIQVLSNVHNRIGKLKATDTARAKAGNDWTVEGIKVGGDALKARSSAVQNEVGDADLSGSSRLHVGTTYGGSSFWD